jgi:integrase
MLGLTGLDITFPEDQGYTIEDRPVTISLCPKGGTKVKRAQVVLVHKQHKQLISTLKTFISSTPPAAKLFPHSLGTYRTVLNKIETSLGLKIGWTPHSPRASFASDCRAEGWSFTETREAGRWASDSSLRTYLDIITSASIATTFRLEGLAPALVVAERNWELYFPGTVLQATYCR